MFLSHLSENGSSLQLETKHLYLCHRPNHRPQEHAWDICTLWCLWYRLSNGPTGSIIHIWCFRFSSCDPIQWDSSLTSYRLIWISRHVNASKTTNWYKESRPGIVSNHTNMYVGPCPSAKPFQLNWKWWILAENLNHIDQTICVYL